MKIGFIFAGQGQQFLYMGKDLAETYPSAKALYLEAQEILGYDVLNLDEEKLHQTEYTQPALFTLGVVLDTVLKEKGITPDMVAGLSLGEYNALVSAEILDFKQALQVIQKRARLMSQAFEPFETAMAACVRTDRQSIEDALKGTNIEVCNVNTPSQIVIGGKKDELDAVVQDLKAQKIRALMLKVSTVSHMSLLKDETKKLKEIIAPLNFSKPKVPFINNVEAKIQDDNFADTLSRQISEPTLMADSIQKMLDEGVDTIIEVGPKNTIVKFVREINKEIDTFNVYDQETLKECLSWIEK